MERGADKTPLDLLLESHIPFQRAGVGTEETRTRVRARKWQEGRSMELTKKEAKTGRREMA
jgi:hypothetical protein